MFHCLVGAATHLRSGHISIKHLGNRECRITIKVYTNSGSAIRFGEGILDFGDGITHTSETVENTPRPDLGPNIATVEYSITHTYPQLGSYLVSYVEANRAAGIINSPNSVETRFCIQSYFTIQSNTDSYQSPIFLQEFFFKSEANNDFAQTFAAVDSNGYRLLYFLAVPLKEREASINPYHTPDSLSINVYNGLMTWDGIFNNASHVGSYLFAARIYQYNGDNMIGYVVRDLQVILVDASPRGWITDTKALNENNRMVVPPNEEDSVKILFNMSDHSGVADVEVISELTNVPGVISYSTYDSTYQSGTLDVKAKVVKLKIKSIANIDRDFPYVITVRGTLLPNLSKDITYLLYTRDIDDSILPITGLTDLSTTITPFPNPVDRYLNVGEAKRVAIFSAHGIKLIEENPVNQIIDLQSLPAGVYILFLEQSPRPPKSYSVIKR